MENKFGIKYSCCINSSCEKIPSVLAVGPCYERGGKAVKKCQDCK